MLAEAHAASECTIVEQYARNTNITSAELLGLHTLIQRDHYDVTQEDMKASALKDERIPQNVRQDFFFRSSGTIWCNFKLR